MSDSPEQLLAPEERVLSTLNADGSRRWLKPRLSKGKFLTARRAVGYGLILLFTLLPHLKLNGRPMVLLDIVRREFTIFGKTFLPTDTLLLALLLLIILMSIFLVTALLGRIWCGWACPQTVYLEFVYRPLERLFDGAPGKRARKHSGVRKLARFVVYLFVSAFLAHTFLSYFVGVENLRHWIFSSPHEHPVAFLVMAATTGLMLFDFSFFREQVCCVVCPYARMQSALLDRDSMIITYDYNRGEPRGKAKRPKKKLETGEAITLPVVEVGDCIDCTMCVQTCPTGIDIRDGLQLECIGCAQCVDACNTVMAKLDRPLGLIRYSSQRAIEDGKSRILRARVIIYPMILAALVTAFTAVLLNKRDAEFLLLRERGLPFQTLASGEIANQMRVRITNRTGEAADYHVEILNQPELRLQSNQNPVHVGPGEQYSDRVLILADPGFFDVSPKTITVRVSDGDTYTEEKPFIIHGPRSRTETPSTGTTNQETPSDG